MPVESFWGGRFHPSMYFRTSIKKRAIEWISQLKLSSICLISWTCLACRSEHFWAFLSSGFSGLRASDFCIYFRDSNGSLTVLLGAVCWKSSSLDMSFDLAGLNALRENSVSDYASNLGVKACVRLLSVFSLFCDSCSLPSSVDVFELSGLVSLIWLGLI